MFQPLPRNHPGQCNPNSAQCEQPVIDPLSSSGKQEYIQVNIDRSMQEYNCQRTSLVRVVAPRRIDGGADNEGDEHPPVQTKTVANLVCSHHPEQGQMPEGMEDSDH